MGKKHSKERREKEGRPTVMTEEVLKKLEEGFSWCYTDAEACLYAGISHQTLYNYQEKHPEFIERKQALRLTPNLTAKKTLVGALSDVTQSRWWAQNKMADEFAPKTKVELGGRIETNDVTQSEAAKAIAEKYERELRESIAAGHKPPTTAVPLQPSATRST